MSRQGRPTIGSLGRSWEDTALVSPICSFIKVFEPDTLPTTYIHALEAWSFGSYRTRYGSAYNSAPAALFGLVWP